VPLVTILNWILICRLKCLWLVLH